MAVDCGRGAQRADGELVQDLEGAGRGEGAAVVVDEERGAVGEGAEEGPGGFGPALFGEVPVDGVGTWGEAEPVGAC